MKLYIFRFNVLNDKKEKDLMLEKLVTTGIMDSKKLFEQRERYKNGRDEYFLVGGRSQNNNYSFFSLKKKGFIKRKEVDDTTVEIRTKEAENDDLGKFAINYSENLIFFYYNGHFGRKQFIGVVKEIIRKALLEEGISGYEFAINYLGCQPQFWKIDTLEKHLKQIKFIKKLYLTMSYPVNFEDENKAGKIEEFVLKGKKEGLTLSTEDIEKIMVTLNEFKFKGDKKIISFECEDTEGHPFTINKNKPLCFEVEELNSMERFEDKVKDSLDEYKKLYY